MQVSSCMLTSRVEDLSWTQTNQALSRFRHWNTKKMKRPGHVLKRKLHMLLKILSQIRILWGHVEALNERILKSLLHGTHLTDWTVMEEKCAKNLPIMRGNMKWLILYCRVSDTKLNGAETSFQSSSLFLIEHGCENRFSPGANGYDTSRRAHSVPPRRDEWLGRNQASNIGQTSDNIHGTKLTGANLLDAKTH